MKRIIFILLVGIALSLTAPPPSAANVVENGNFSTDTLTDWTVQNCTTGCFDAAWGVYTFPNDPGMTPTDTSYAAYTPCVTAGCNNPVTGESISQSLTTVASQSYTLTFLYDPGPDSGGNYDDTELDAFWDGSLVSQIIDATSSTWQEYTITGLVATSASTELEFTGRQDPSALYLTDISVNPGVSVTPEPPSMLLMGTGLLVLVACRGENVTAAATTKGRKQVYAWRVPAI